MRYPGSRTYCANSVNLSLQRNYTVVTPRFWERNADVAQSET